MHGLFMPVLDVLIFFLLDRFSVCSQEAFPGNFIFHYLFVRMFENRCCVPLSFSNQMLVFLELSPLLSLAVVLYNFQT